MRCGGVIDARQRVFGYENLLVCDGSAIPAKPRLLEAIVGVSGG